MTPGPDEATLAPQVDGGALSFAAPRILIYRNTGHAEFISAVWNDASGKPSHQRDVFVVKPDYGVVVDYVYGEGERSIARSFIFSSGNVVSDKLGAQAALDGGKNFRVQANDAVAAGLTARTSGRKVVFSSAVKIPAPVPTVFLTWTGTAAPAVEYVKPANLMVVKFKVTFPNGRVDQVALAWEVRPLHIGGKSFNGWAACASQGPAGACSIEIN